MSAIARSNPAAAGVPLAAHAAPLIPVVTFGWSVSSFFAVTYVVCVIGYLVIPGSFINHAALSLFLPGFKLLDWPNFFLGLAESFAFGWYVALVFAPIYNFFAARRR
jgi:hypothetical protein